MKTLHNAKKPIGENIRMEEYVPRGKSKIFPPGVFLLSAFTRLDNPFFPLHLGWPLR